MTKILMYAVAASAVIALNANALPITIGNATHQGTSPINPMADDIETITGCDDLTLLYKTGGEEGPFKDSYTTSFGDQNEDGQIAYDGGGAPSIAPASDCLWLIAKDGADHDPVWYLWDLSAAGLGWNGTDTLDIGVLWPEQGAISYVGIYGGGSEPEAVPEGGSTVILLGSALLGVGFFRRRFLRA